jgi:hypothetical protein
MGASEFLEKKKQKQKKKKTCSLLMDLESILSLHSSWNQASIFQLQHEIFLLKLGTQKYQII